MKLQRPELKLVLLLAALQFTHMMDFVVMMPLAPQFMRYFSITPNEFGTLVSAYTWSSAVFGFLGAFFIDKFDRKKCLLTVYTGFIAGTALCAVSRSVLFLLVARSVAGAFAGVQAATIFAMVGDKIPESRRGTAMGMLMVSFPVASVVGVPVGLLLANWGDWHTPFTFLALLSTVLLAMGAVMLPSMRGHISSDASKREHPVRQIQKIFMETRHYWAFSLMALMMGSAFLLIPYLSAYLVGNVGIPENQLFMVYLFGGGFTFFTAQMVGRLSDRYGKLIVFRVLMLLSIIPVYVITNMGHASLFYAVTLTTFFMIFNSGRMVPAMAIITSSIEPARRGGFMSLVTAIQHFFAGVASFAGGVILEKSMNGELLFYDRLGWITIILSLACLLVAPHIKIFKHDSHS